MFQDDGLLAKPAESLQTHVVARMDPAHFARPSMSGWTFGDSADVAELLGEPKPLGHRLEIETPDLDKKGSTKAALDLPSILAAAPEKSESSAASKSTDQTYTGPWRLSVTASVLEPGGRAVSAT